MSSYAHLSVHRWMLRDAVRNEAFREAIARTVKPGDVVLDLGTGTGILSLFAAAAGAKKVFAVERTEVAAVARRLIAENGRGDCIEVLQTDVEDVELDQRVDVLVSEWMGGLGVDENMLAPLVIARDRWLKPGGKIIPGRVTAMLAPASIEGLDRELAFWRSSPHGVDFGLISDITANEVSCSQVAIELKDLLAAPKAMWSHDPHSCTLDEADRSFVCNLQFQTSRAGMISGLVAWFRAEMGEGRTLSNAVGATPTHWGTMIFPLAEPVALAEGDAIDVEVHCDPVFVGSCEFSWAVKLPNRSREHHDTRPRRQRLR